MLSYALKRVLRSFGLFAALLLGVMLASSFFAGINIGADTTAKAALTQQLSSIPVDIVVSSGSIINSSVWETAVAEVKQVKGVKSVEILSRGSCLYVENITSHEGLFILTVGTSNVSSVYDGLTVLSQGSAKLGANETYVWVGSKAANRIALNSVITLNFTYRTAWEEKFLVLPLKVVGFVELNDEAYSIAAGEWGGPVTIYQSSPGQAYVHVERRSGALAFGDLLLIVSWEETFAKILDNLPEDVPTYSLPFSTQILVYIDRNSLVNPWDIPNSLNAVRKVTLQVNDRTAKYGMYASNNLENILKMYQFTSISMRFSFFIVALPVFFVAWYVGTTVSDVSYNLRRREIGLLLTKGFSNAQLFRLFLTESIMIGIMGGLLGVGIGFLLGPIFTAGSNGALGTPPVLSTGVIIITVIFGLAITLLSTFRPSRKAAKLPAVEALREYTYTEEFKPHKQRLPWLAFSLGLYKIVMFLFGINLVQVFAGAPPPFTNIFLIILLGIWIIIDTVLTYIGPLLFFWGFSKIFISGSVKFQELVARAARFLGDLGTLAMRNVQRNPVRVASIAFLIALIVGYSFQTIGAVASEQDYIIRQVKADVGADIRVALASTTNISQTLNIIGNLSGVDSLTLEYSLGGTLPGDAYQRQIRMINPDTWLSTAYYEEEWFSGNGVAEAFQQMKTNNQTIILERTVALSLDKKLGDNITMTIGSSIFELKIVGFFGPEVTQQYIGGGRIFWSYAPTGLLHSLILDYQPSATVLVKLEPSADGKAVASEIQKMDNVSYVRSVAEELETYQSNLLLSGSLNIQRIGVLFSIMAAAVAVGLATLVSLQERKREASIMSARGLSFKQLVTMLLTENLAVIAFSVVLGVIVGLIVVHGNIAASNATLSAYSLVMHKMVFPPEVITLLATCLTLIFASTIIPTLLLTKRYISKVERIVRL
ncbi:MAG: FtsX-like permease family protein [Candidatus Bathyarchaeales archaeon]